MKAILIYFLFAITLHANDCELFKVGPSFSYSPNFNNLTSYWNQELTGVDLVKNQIDISKLINKSFDIWDTSSNGHGSMVSNIISGPKDSAYIKANSEIDHRSFIDIIKFFKSGKSVDEFCLEYFCPNYINISMSFYTDKFFISGEDLDLLVEKMKEMHDKKGVVFIISAGNLDMEINDRKKILGKDYAILVSSIEPDGLPSYRYSSGEEITISAPSGYSIVSHNSSGPQVFGATSAATPQITASLVMFSAITGYKLSLEEAKEILIKTALPIVGLPEKSNHGSGLLNYYKIFKLAEKIKKTCLTDLKCVKSNIFKKQNYQFDIDVNLDQDEKCLKKKRLIDLKQKFLLKENKEAAIEISKIYSENKFSKNELIYKEYAERFSQSDKEVLEKNKLDNNYINLYRYIYANSNFQLTLNEKEKLLNKSVTKDLLIQFILPNNINEENSKIVDSIILSHDHMYLDHFLFYDNSAGWSKFYQNRFKVTDRNQEINSSFILKYLQK